MKNLTRRQQEVLTYIKEFLEENSYWPSVRDIQAHFKFKSPNAALGHLRALEKKNCLQRSASHARAFRFPEEINATPVAEPPENAIDVVEIPIYGSIAAGYPDGIESAGVIGRLQIDVETSGVRESRQPFALRVRGESMINAGIYDGDVVILEQAEPRNGDIVAALIDNETTLKRFVKTSGQAYLKAENPDYPELHPITELVIQGVARAVTRQLSA